MRFLANIVISHLAFPGSLGPLCVLGRSLTPHIPKLPHFYRIVCLNTFDQNGVKIYRLDRILVPDWTKRVTRSSQTLYKRIFISQKISSFEGSPVSLETQ